MTTPRVWLITGASSGFGKALTEFVLSQGDIAVATLRKPEVLQELSASYSEDRLRVVKVDVTNQADIDYVFALTKEVFGKLDVVFNNAGYTLFGDAETTPANAARSLFNVNFWGAVNVSQAAIKFFREVNAPGQGGVLLQTSSIVGINSPPGFAFYVASKHALAGFSESLAKEIFPEWNIKICIIEPGGFGTSVLNNAIFLPESPVYSHETSVLQTMRNKLTTEEGEVLPGDSTKFAKAIYSLVEGGDIPLHLPMGQDALTATEKKVESLGKGLAEVAHWSVDLLRNGVARAIPLA